MAATLSPQSVFTTHDVNYGAAAPTDIRSFSDPSRQLLDAALGRLAVRAVQCRSVEQAARIAATTFAELIGGGRLAIGVVRPNSTACTLAALSSVPSIDHRADRSQSLQAALDEVILNDATTRYGGGVETPADVPRLPLKAHEHTARATGSRAIVGVPLKTDDTTTGALLWFDEGRPIDAIGVQATLVHAAGFLAPALHSVARAERSAIGRIQDRLRDLTRGKRRQYVSITAAALLCVLLVPLRYRVACTARLEPTVRRYVVAPFESVLEKTLARPGDLVEQNQVVARLDGREVGWNLASVEAELAQAITRYDKALADRKPTEAELARKEVEVYGLQQRQLQSQQERLQIKSPLAGVVLSGELERAEGAALTTGQTLLEIAPLGELLVEIAVPDDRLRFVQAGQYVSVKLDAFPGRTWTGAVERVRPLAEIRDSQNVFIAEVRLENGKGSLRPGMNGGAKIAGPIRPLAWILFHRPFEALRQWMGW